MLDTAWARAVPRQPIRRFYLAHAIADRHWVRQRELGMEALTNGALELVNPFYDAEQDMTEVDAGRVDVYAPKEKPELIVGRDLALIKECDGLVGIFSSSWTVGVHMEMFHAAELLKPVFAVAYDSRAWRHPWVRYCVGNGVFATLEEFTVSGVWKEKRNAR